jgi:mannitol 2-dehydrogenase
MAAAGDPREPESGAPLRLSAATVASWARYAEGVDEQGTPIDVQDQLAETLVPLAKSQRENPLAFIQNTAVFGDLAQHERFVDAYLWALDSLHRDGARDTLNDLIPDRDRTRPGHR